MALSQKHISEPTAEAKKWKSLKETDGTFTRSLKTADICREILPQIPKVEELEGNRWHFHGNAAVIDGWHRERGRA